MEIIKKLMSEMTLKEKVYQTVVQRSENYIYDETAKEKLEAEPFGGFFCWGRNNWKKSHEGRRDNRSYKAS